MPLLAIYSWDQFTIPTGIPAGDLTGDTHPNDPASPGYSATATSWIGETFTFDGGAPSQIDISDDDGDFQDGYVETGGAQTLTSDVTINGTLYLAGSVVENEFSLIDAGGQEIYVVRINGENVGFAYQVGDEPVAGEQFTAAQGLDGDPADNADGTSSSQEPYANVICFASGTRIATPGDERAIETLQAGDLVITRDAGAQRVIWTGRTDLRFPQSPGRVKPIIFAPGSLGPGQPARPLAVSPQHRVLIEGSEVQALFGVSEVLAPAKGLTGLPGVRQMRGKRAVSYFHLLLERHAVIAADGAPAESLYPGKQAMRMMGAEQAQVVAGLVPGVNEDPEGKYGPPAGRVLTRHEAEALVRRILFARRAEARRERRALRQSPQLAVIRSVKL